MRHRPTPITALLGLAAALTGFVALTGCGSDTSPEIADQPIAASVEGADTVVIVDDHAYQPAQLEISVGETVGWSFQDSVDHDAAFDDGPASPVQRSGTWTRTFDEPGTDDYLCRLHPR